MNDATLRSFVERWVAATTQRARALVEDQLWQYMPPEERGESARRQYRLAELLPGAKPYEVDKRLRLIGTDPVGLLWDRVEAGMAFGAADKIGKAARRRARREGIMLLDALRVELEAYDRLPVAVRSTTGRVFKKKTRKPRAHAADTVASAYEFWSTVRAMFDRVFGPKLAGLPEVEVERLAEMLRRDLTNLIEEHGKRIYCAATGVAKTAAPSRARLVGACRTLHMDPPSGGAPIDMKAAGRQKRRLARAYHPDAHNGSGHLRRQFDDVIAAYAVIEAYNESLAPRERARS